MLLLLKLFFVFKNFKYDFNLCDDCYRCKQRETVSKAALFWIVKVKSGTFRTLSEYKSNKLLTYLKKHSWTRNMVY